MSDRTIIAPTQNLKRIAMMMAGCFALVVFSMAFCVHAQNKKAISKNGLIDAMHIGGLSQSELIKQVEQRGVEFELTSAIQSELVKAGASPELLRVVRENYRPENSAAITIPDGTELSLVTVSDIAINSIHEGDPVSFKIEKDIVVNHQVVIASDTIAKGRFSYSDSSGAIGTGKLGIKLESTTAVDGQHIRLRASNSDKSMTEVALDKVFKVLTIFKKNSDPKIKSGTKMKAYTAEEKRIRIKT
jgi:hypothetical protein